jgi:hypothetical protein
MGADQVTDQKLMRVSILRERTTTQWVTVAVVRTLVGFVEVWALMLLIGAAHHEISAAVPALGYWQVWIVYLIAGIILPTTGIRFVDLAR